MVRQTGAVLFAALLLAPTAARAQAKSTDLAKQLGQMLDGKKMDCIAAADAQNADGFVAALYFPGTQLLVVSAKYAAPQLLAEKLLQKNYRDIYIDLSSASVAGSKLFVMDTFADGLVAKPGGDTAADSVDQGTTQLTFDGNWKKAKMSEAEYMKAFDDAEAGYVRALQILIAKLKAPGT